eukprot:1145526-Pelagomonas_calceolata.AAC.8
MHFDCYICSVTGYTAAATPAHTAGRLESTRLNSTLSCRAAWMSFICTFRDKAAPPSFALPAPPPFADTRLHPAASTPTKPVCDKSCMVLRNSCIAEGRNQGAPMTAPGLWGLHPAVLCILPCEPAPKVAAPAAELLLCCVALRCVSVAKGFELFSGFGPSIDGPQ